MNGVSAFRRRATCICGPLTTVSRRVPVRNYTIATRWTILGPGLAGPDNTGGIPLNELNPTGI